MPSFWGPVDCRFSSSQLLIQLSMRELRMNPRLLHALKEQRFSPPEMRALICQGRVMRLWFPVVDFLTVLRCLPL